MSAILWFAVACGLVALAYGLYATRSVLSASAGTERMQEIAGAVQEGARAYLNRQYLTISLVGAGTVRHSDRAARPSGGHRLPDRCGSFRRGRLHRHACLRAGECADRRCGQDRRAQARAKRRLPLGRNHRPSGGGPRPPRRHRLLRDPADRGGRDEDRAGSARGTWLRRLAHLDLRAAGRRHLHQGRRRGRRPGRQGGSRHSRGRPAQPRGDRRQCRRQCGRLRRHGGGPLRDLCRHHRRHHAARGGVLHRAVAAIAHALPAGYRRRLHPGVGDRHVLRPPRQEPEDHARALSRLPGLRRALRHRVLSDHRLGGGLEHRVHSRRRDGLGPRPLPLRVDRAGGDRPHDLGHRILHVDRVRAGARYRQGVDHGGCHQHHPGACDLHAGDGASRDHHLGRDHPRLSRCRPIRHRDRGDSDAGARRHGRCPRCLWPGDRQCRRHRRDGGLARGRAANDRRAGCGRQHHQGGDQGLRHRLRRACCACAVHGLYRGSGAILPGRPSSTTR